MMMSSKLSKRSISLLIALVLVMVTASAIWGLKLTAKQPERKPSQERAWKVEVMTVAKQDHQPELTLYGRVESPFETTLTAATTAYIEAVPVREGMLVQQGQVLVKLDQRDLLLKKNQREADILNIKAKIATQNTRYQYDQRSLVEEKKLLVIARNAVARQSSLKQRNLSSVTQLEEAKQGEVRQALNVNKMEQAIADHDNQLQQLQAQLKQAEALLAGTLLDLERATVKAPLTGRISQVQVAPGARVKEGEPLLTLYDVANLEVRAQLPSRLLPRLKTQNPLIGQQVLPDHTTQKVDDNRSTTLVGILQGTLSEVQGTLSEVTEAQVNNRLSVQLDRFAAAVSQGQGGVDGIFRITSTSLPNLELGRSVVLTLQLPPVDDSMAVPVTAVYNNQRVFKVVDNFLQSVSVEKIGELKREGKEWALIRSSQLQVGDQLMITQIPNAITGMKVQLTSTVVNPVKKQQPAKLLSNS
ncbi:biotin/lipoyl-binding protein [Endozoicomonas sp. SM1973]|uniref:Biotin/lipoyl-binding protein n=1 Tax=Spartinivicinus marinus TaxID=2994442 RepID=A0A853I6K0_9GAMM|nr:biotin/lipoyl-binding protein [Spartinivicinus marinus]MCX4024675.1 biotin/lipoyl-binding protein [Spartinivicinus marinus]NYZ66298.1 biotin/lipoyl-binding protein [Spartinivicinus marinus]